nr:DUF131 domain-containing protein [Candidatus Njordarchaeum guaymaensis]
MTNEGRFITAGAILSVIGLVAIVTGLVANSLMAGNGGSTSFGSVVMIGPIPLIFGTDRTALTVAVVGAVILMAVAFAITYMGARKKVVVDQEV